MYLTFCICIYRLRFEVSWSDELLSVRALIAGWLPPVVSVLLCPILATSVTLRSQNDFQLVQAKYSWSTFWQETIHSNGASSVEFSLTARLTCSVTCDLQILSNLKHIYLANASRLNMIFCWRLQFDRSLYIWQIVLFCVFANPAVLSTGSLSVCWFYCFILDCLSCFILFKKTLLLSFLSHYCKC